MANGMHSAVVSREKKKMLFIVGAYHVCGKDNVIDSLKKTGLTVNKVVDVSDDE
jgi:uncharacterized protein YbaP (TraB family)